MKLHTFQSSPALLGSIIPHIEAMFPNLVPFIRSGEASVQVFESTDTNRYLASVGFRYDEAKTLLGLHSGGLLEELIYRDYAALINHKRPRKISWRRLNRHQRKRAVELYEAGLL